MSHSATLLYKTRLLHRPWAVVALIVAALLVTGTIMKLTSGPSGAETAKTYGIYSGKEVPTILSQDDHRAIELGTVFQVSSPGQAVAIRYYKSVANTGPHTGTLWNSTGQKLATVTFHRESRSGFQTAKLSNPVTLKPYQNYVVSYHAPRGEWSSQLGTYNNGSAIGNAVIKGTKGVYAFGTSTTFPTGNYHNSSYYVDVLFAPTGSPVTPPTTASSSASASKSPTKAPTTSPVKPTSSAPTKSSTPSKPPSTSSSPSTAPTSSGVPVGTTMRTVPGQLTSGPGWTWTGSALKLTGGNVTLNGLDINGPVQGSFSNVTIQNSHIRCTGETQWCISLGDHNKLINDEIGGGANGSTFVSAIGVWSGGSGSNNIINGVDIHNTSDGLRIDGGTTLMDSYVHNLVMGDSVAAGAHSDGVQSTGGSNVTISNNRFESGTNCNVFMQWLSGNPAITNYTVTGNTFTAGNRNGLQTSYGVCGYSPDVSGVSITNNTFGYGFQVGPFTAPSGSNISGNKYTDGKPITG